MKDMGGDLATRVRSKMRKECYALGPVGFLLESMHLQAAAMDDQYTMRQANQPVIAKAPIQQLATLVRQLATINRTRRADDERMETTGLEEIDGYARDAEHKDTGGRGRRGILNILRAGSTWTRTAAYWSGIKDDNICQRCMVAVGKTDHIWECCKLKEKTNEVDKDLAAIRGC